MDILAAILTLGGLGILFGAGLAFASKKFCVVVDPRVEKIFSELPGANCGACGMPGCMGFAEGLVHGACSPEKCPVSSDETRRKMAQVLGIEFKEKVKLVATLYCNGGSQRVKDRFNYRGEKDCIAASIVLGGQKACTWGCLGFGTCVNVCPFGALSMSSEGLPVVDEKKCRACNKCVEVCPKKLFSLVPVASRVYVACSSKDAGKDTRAVCPVGCIACRKCEQACKYDAIHVVNNLAVIDYNKCTSCGDCVKVCPMKTIRIKP